MSTGLSFFSLTLNGVNLTVDCTMLDIDAIDVDQGLVGLGYADAGGISASTGLGFIVQLPLSAQRLRYSPIQTFYPIQTWTGIQTAGDMAESTFAFQVRAVDDSGQVWTSCGAGSCGIPSATVGHPNPDPAHNHHLDSVVEEATGLPGVAAFRVSGSFSAMMTNASGSLAPAQGAWSLRLVVPTPGPLDCFYGCVTTDGTCLAGDSDIVCGNNGARCGNCSSSNYVCADKTCVPCRPGTMGSESCNGGCGSQSYTCDDNGFPGPLSPETCPSLQCYGSTCCAPGSCGICTGDSVPSCMTPPVSPRCHIIR
jgi:hypothetical protein